MELKDREHVEHIEAELDALVERRAQATKADEERAELWRASVERYHEKRRRANQAAWYAHECHMERLHLDLAEEHRLKALRYLKEAG